MHSFMMFSVIKNNICPTVPSCFFCLPHVLLTKVYHKFLKNFKSILDLLINTVKTWKEDKLFMYRIILAHNSNFYTYTINLRNGKLDVLSTNYCEVHMQPYTSIYGIFKKNRASSFRKNLDDFIYTGEKFIVIIILIDN